MLAIKCNKVFSFRKYSVSIINKPINGCHDFTDSSSETDLLLVEVEDQGIGVPQEHVNRLFQPFAQTQRHAGGTGLGLYSLALRIKELQGFYGFRAVPSHSGSIFYFAIPFRESSAAHWDIKAIDAVYNGNETEEASVSSMDLSNKYTCCREDMTYSNQPVVLVVDDSAPTLRILCRALKQSGIEVETASDGFTALQMMKTKLYTSVVMDIQMPVMDGIEAIRQLRQWEISCSLDKKHQHVLAASASYELSIKNEACTAGADSFSVKPLSFAQLENSIKSLHSVV